MKNVFFTRAEQFLKLRELYIVAGIALATYGAWAANILTLRLCLALWQLALVAIVPLAFYLLCRMVYHRRKRLYKTGDLVQIIADERKFVAIRYLFWQPCHVVCKEYSQSNIITVHQKYLLPYKEPEVFDPLKWLAKPNINTAVRTGTITKL